MGVPIKLTSNIYAYEEKNLMKEITTCSVKHHIQTPSISLGVLTTKSWGCEDRKPVQRLSNWLSSLVRLIIQSLPLPSLVVLLNKKLKLINLPSQRLLLMKSVKPFFFFSLSDSPTFPTVRHHRLRRLREPDSKKLAGCAEVFTDAWGDPTCGSCALLHGGQRPLHSCGSGCGAGERHAVPHYIFGHR